MKNWTNEKSSEMDHLDHNQISIGSQISMHFTDFRVGFLHLGMSARIWLVWGCQGHPRTRGNPCISWSPVRENMYFVDFGEPNNRRVWSRWPIGCDIPFFNFSIFHLSSKYFLTFVVTAAHSNEFLFYLTNFPDIFDWKIIRQYAKNRVETP